MVVGCGKSGQSAATVVIDEFEPSPRFESFRQCGGSRGGQDMNALRLRLFAVKDRNCADFPGQKSDGSYEDFIKERTKAKVFFHTDGDVFDLIPDFIPVLGLVAVMGAFVQAVVGLGMGLVITALTVSLAVASGGLLLRRLATIRNP